MSTAADIIRRDQVLGQAVKDGKFSTARLPWFQALWAKDPEGTAAFVKQLAGLGRPLDQAQRATPSSAYNPRTSKPSRHSNVVEMPSQLRHGATVTIDEYALNPLLEDARQALPYEYAEASRRGPAPTLFPTGDLPVYMASGADPSLLLELPWPFRHAGATADQAHLAALLSDPLAVGTSINAEGRPVIAQDNENAAYRDRIKAWLLPRPAAPGANWNQQ